MMLLRMGLNERKEDYIIPESGFLRFWYFFRKNFWNMLKLNMLFLVCCLPVFTIFPAVSALSKVYYMMVEERSFTPVSDFFGVFKSLVSTCALIGSVYTALFTGLSALTIYTINMGREMFWLTAVCAAILFIVMMTSVYLPQLIAIVDLPVRVLIKNSLHISIMHLGRSLISVALCYGTLIAVIVFFPYSAIYAILGCFTLVLFISNFITLKGIRCCIKPK